MTKFGFLLKWKLAFKVGAIAVVLALVKLGFIFFGLEIFDVNPFLPSLLGGVVVLLGFLLAGVLADFKESEKIPTEIAAALRNIYEEGLYLKELKNEFNLEKLRANVHGIVSSFLGEIGNGNNVGKTLKAVSQLNESFLEMDGLAVPPPLMARLKNEQGSLRRTILRANYIKTNSFVVVAYIIAMVASGIVLLFLLLLKSNPPIEGIAILFAIAFLLVYLLLLIRDMDDPFEFSDDGSPSFTADVNPSQLYDLKRELETADEGK
ncbi:MAG: hypothetical protein HY671_07970 [Chloroflexi bacterium]|nr:hypothetical protein [Chloroflexota bacterium]